MSTTAVLCFPPAGAGATFYREWPVSETLRIVPVELPGREKRFADPVPTDVGSLVGDLVPDLLTSIDNVSKAVFFGHSFGAVLAYEAVHAVLAAAPEVDATLVVSGSPGPSTLRGTRISGRDDDSFVASVRAIAGYQHPALDDPELRDLVLPTLRADVLLHENYRPAGRPRLPIPVYSVRGTADDVVSAADAQEWSDVTTGDFELVELPGGHMYLVDSAAELLDRIGRLPHPADARP
ncbi:thioesterase [Saccharomonospora piscinae]|uniref:thioesterase II family protein n=1 Tax=Saccharomonospora piscinae TaxID=687388 RepID=UPI001105DB6A|nr:alpha/beta fold hydrolase [Saccharomonospora piscinae]TLW90614.1 thioesterase [Saccharomonospora piscinae]